MLHNFSKLQYYEKYTSNAYIILCIYVFSARLFDHLPRLRIILYPHDHLIGILQILKLSSLLNTKLYCEKEKKTSFNFQNV